MFFSQSFECSTVNCVKNVFHIQNNYKSTVKCINQEDKMLTVNNTYGKKGLSVCMNFGRRDNIMAKLLCT